MTREERVARLRENARRQGLRLTPQRDVLLRVLGMIPHHATADELYRRVKRLMPSMSPATVYRNAQTLVRAGVISALERAGGPARYDVNLDDHHHFVCDRCDRVFDVRVTDVAWRVPPRDPGLAGARITKYRLHLRGVCGACRAAESR